MATDDGAVGESDRVRVHITATERLGNALTRVRYEICLPGGRPPVAGELSLPFPSSMSRVDAELRMAVWEAVADAGLPRQLGEELVLG